MGFISSVEHGIGVATQGASDIFANGPAGIAMRQELDHLHSQITKVIGQYNNLHRDNTAWRDPIDDCGKYTSSLLHQTSDFVHGIALNYKEVISDNSLNVPNIKNLGNANIVQPLVNIPIPGDFGGFPSALVPGVETLKMVEGLINVFASSFTLGTQLHEARSNLNKAIAYTRQAAQLLNEMEELKNYFLEIANNVLGVFRKTTGLNLPHLSANTASDLTNTNQTMIKLITQLTNTKGNAFTICRFILNLIKEKNISSPSETQIQWIANTLYTTIDGIQSSFESEVNVATFVRNYFGAQLLTPAILLHLPEPPDNLKKYIKESPPSHTTFADPNSSKYDPPKVNLNNFPS